MGIEELLVEPREKLCPKDNREPREKDYPLAPGAHTGRHRDDGQPGHGDEVQVMATQIPHLREESPQDEVEQRRHARQQDRSPHDPSRPDRLRQSQKGPDHHQRHGHRAAVEFKPSRQKNGGHPARKKKEQSGRRQPVHTHGSGLDRMVAHGVNLETGGGERFTQEQ